MQDDHVLVLSKTPNRDYKVDTPGGGVPSQPLRVSLSHRWHLQTCLGTEPVVITFPDHNKSLTRTLGQSGDITEGFQQLTLTTQTAQTIIITCGDDEERDTRASSGSVVQAPTSFSLVAAVNEGPLVLAAGTGNALGLGLAQVPRKVWVSAHPANAGPVFVDADAATQNGLILMPGEVQALTAASLWVGGVPLINFFNPNAVACTVYARWEL